MSEELDDQTAADSVSMADPDAAVDPVAVPPVPSGAEPAAPEPKQRPRHRISFAWARWPYDAVRRWLARRPERAPVVEVPERTLALLDQAYAARATAEREAGIRVAGAPGRGGLAVLALYRHAVTLALASGAADSTDAGPLDALRQRLPGTETRWFTTPPDELVGDPDRVRSMIASAAAALEQVLADADAVRRRRARARRSRRIAWGAVALLGLAIAVRLTAGKPRVDLAEDADWTTSSDYAAFDPETKKVDSKSTDVFFHTKRESRPWIEYDLGRKRSVGRVVITNRGDCCRDRAVNSVIEVSNDGEKWRILKTRKEAFRVWNASFPREKVRYVRFRSLKTTRLHLQRVEIYAR